MTLWQDFLTNQGRIIHKWVHYFPIYEKHFASWRNKSLTFFEIGVMYGGSLDMWQRYFGSLATIVGIDINPACKKVEKPGISVRIGDQSDPAFLGSLIDEFGAPDIVLDDGSHQMAHIIKSFDYLYPKVPKNGVYMVEDLHTAYWKEFGGGVNEEGTFINISKRFVDQLNAHYSRGALQPDMITRDTFCISFYDSIVAFDKAQIPRRDSLAIGRTDPQYPPSVAYPLPSAP